MTEVWQYCEVWTGIEAAGGTRLGFFHPIAPKRRRRLNGDDALSFGIPKTHRLVALIDKGKAIREVLSADGTSYREWVVDTYSWGSGYDLVMQVDCLSPITLLQNYPVTTTDADGYVYSDTGAIQLTPTAIITSFVRSNTPSWMGTGTVTPTALAEIPFSQDSALSGMRRMEDLIPGYETTFERSGTTAYNIGLQAIGSGASTLYLRTAKNLKSLRKEVQAGQITRINQVSGADGDDGPSGLAWAFWEVVSTSGAGPYSVVLKAIHGGDGPIKYDNQFNHSGLPGGANSLYMEKRDGTFTQITGSVASTQTITVASITTVTAGDWVRIVASSTGKHLTSLDSPTDLATYGVLGGRYESSWDDTVCVVKNSLQEDWSSTLPTGWTADASASKSTTDGTWLTSGAAISVNALINSSFVVARPPDRSWYIRSRRTNYSAVAWIRLRGAVSGSGALRLQVSVNGTVIAFLDYVTPINAWRQLKIEGIDLSAYVGTTVTLRVALVLGGTGASTINALIDSVCLTPSIAARAVTTGSNAARIWQGANTFLDDKRTLQAVYSVNAADLARMGVANQTDVTLGGTAIVVDDEVGTVTGRVVEISDLPDDPGDARYVISTLPSRLSRTQSKPPELVIPFFEPIAVRVADRDTRNAALKISATVTATDATTVTVSVAASDTLGGTPTIAYAAFGAVYASGSYVFTRPAYGLGTGRVVFTATLAGRTDVTDAVDVPEQVPTGPSLTVNVTPGTTADSIAYTSTGTLTVSIDGGTYGSPAASPISVTKPAAGSADKTYDFKCVGADGTTMSSSVKVAALVTSTGGAIASISSFYVTSVTTSTDLIVLAATVVNAPSGGSYDLVWSNDFDAATVNSGTITGISLPYSFNTQTYQDADLVAKGTSGYVTIQYTFELRMLDSGSAVVATAQAVRTVYVLYSP